MKKRIVILLLIVAFSAALASACSSDLSKNKLVSELRSDILMGENADYKVVIVTGFREEPFEYDGISSEQKKQYTVITVTPTTYNPGAQYTFKAQINGTEFSGSLLKHPFNQTYSAEIDLAQEGVEINVTIIYQATSAEITAVSVKNESFISGQKAFDIAKKNLDIPKDSEYEIFVRLIENPINSAGGYYWYVAFYFTDKTTLAVLIDPVTTEIIAHRT